LVGPDLSGGQKVSQIVSIELVIPWDLELSGASDYLMPNIEFETEVAANGVSWDDEGDLWNGLALWRLAAIVDDGDPTTFNETLAALGYDIKVIASDGYNKTFSSADIALNDDILVANTFNGYPLPASRFPLRVVGPDLSGSFKVAQIVRIELLNVPELMDFSVEHMYINFADHRPWNDGNIAASGSFSLPEGASYDLDSNDVTVDVDGVSITIPAGSFNKRRWREMYTYYSSWGSSPYIAMTLNFDKGEWGLIVRDIDASVIDNCDGVDVTLMIDSIVGMEHIEMHVDSLSY
jgi:hypothetical protein